MESTLREVPRFIEHAKCRELGNLTAPHVYTFPGADTAHLDAGYVRLRHGLWTGRPTFDRCRNCDRITRDNLEKRALRTALAHTFASAGRTGQA